MPMNLACVDFSGVYWRWWHALLNEEVSEAHNRTVRRCMDYAEKHDHTAICIDMPPYLRKDIDPSYKENREKQPEVAIEQMKEAIARLRADGYHVIGSKGYEADDIIGTICKWSEFEGHSMTVYSADKDLLQLVAPNTVVVSTANHVRYETEDSVVAKLGVVPRQVPEWLALVGDGSDNIPGIKGVGPKTAAKWLTDFGDLASVMGNCKKLGRFADDVAANKSEISKWLTLTQLMDAPINPVDMLKPLEPIVTDVEMFPESDCNARPIEDTERAENAPVAEGPDKNGEIATASSAQVSMDTPEYDPSTCGVLPPPPQVEPPTQAIAISQPEVITWDRELEPRSVEAASKCARMMVETRFFANLAKPQQALAVMMTGRAFGLGAMASLQGFHVIKGKVCPSSQLLVGLVKRSPVCEFFRLVSTTDTEATWETRRVGEPEPTPMTYTIAMAERAGLLFQRQGKEPNQWAKRPETMLRWRCASSLARVVFADIIGGLYTVEEMRDED